MNAATYSYIVREFAKDLDQEVIDAGALCKGPGGVDTGLIRFVIDYQDRAAGQGAEAQEDLRTDFERAGQGYPQPAGGEENR